MPGEAFRFPDGFVWGCSTAAHQVEGQNFNNDWWDWEQAGGKIKHGHSSRLACDWWGGRYRGDFERARALGANALRFSLEWSRLEPREGEWDKEATRTYRDMLRALRDVGLAPLVTLHHFTNPRWFMAQGGWERPAAVEQFRRFAGRAARELGDLCDWWVTINEPNVYATLCYAVGEWPPQRRGLRPALNVFKHMLQAHAAAYRALKERQPEGRVGLAHHWRHFAPHRRASPLDQLAARWRDRFFNGLALAALYTGALAVPFMGRAEMAGVRGAHDFIGLNYFVGETTAFDVSRPVELFGRAVLDADAQKWKPMFAAASRPRPDGLESALRRLARFDRPIYVTENGIFDAGDGSQADYLISHLQAVQSGLQAGVPVGGYFWWTLVDNFEWSEGFGPRFGLYHLDHDSQRRTARPVAEAFARIIRENMITSEMLRR